METETKLHELLTLIKVEEYPPERVTQLWKKLEEQDYAFDDTMKGDSNVFISQLLLPNNLFFELGDLAGLVCATGIVPKVGCQLHFLVWERQSVTKLREAGKSLIDNLFSSYELNRISAFIPAGNLQAIRLAVTFGFAYEGSMRGAFLHNGEYEDIHIYGLLHSDFIRVRRF